MEISELKYNEPFEVTKQQYDKIIVEFAGIIAHRNFDGKYFIKLWIMKYKHSLLNRLNSLKIVS